MRSSIVNKTPELQIDVALVRRLVTTHFPHWSDLPITQIKEEGWSNKVFRLGNEMIVRLPRLPEYAVQVTREHHWLPRLAPELPLRIPEPLAMGLPGDFYPWHWSVYRWINGEMVIPSRVDDMNTFARDLGRFLAALQRVNVSNGPPPGRHNFWRGGALSIYDTETHRAITLLEHRIDATMAKQVWANAQATHWDRSPVWIHGDIAIGNLLLNEGKLCAVLDFGNFGVGDPACDLAIAWNIFSREMRAIFRAELRADDETWARGRAWALWKALIIEAGTSTSNAFEASQSRRIIDEILADYETSRR